MLILGVTKEYYTLKLKYLFSLIYAYLTFLKIRAIEEKSDYNFITQHLYLLGKLHKGFT